MSDKIGLVLINGKEVDMARSLPLKIGQMKKLKKTHGLDLSKSQDGIDIEGMSNLIYFICHESNSDITIEDIDEVSSLQLGKIMEVFTQLQREIDPPT